MQNITSYCYATEDSVAKVEQSIHNFEKLFSGYTEAFSQYI